MHKETTIRHSTSSRGVLRKREQRLAGISVGGGAGGGVLAADATLVLHPAEHDAQPEPYGVVVVVWCPHSWWNQSQCI